MDDLGEVTLEIEGNRIKCRKSVLVAHSDYFGVMFEGSFRERYQDNITIEEVDFKAFQIILNLLDDETSSVIEVEDLLVVLQAASMLQFLRIKSTCIEILTESLCLENCLRIWLVAESLDITPIYLKAKNLALIEFPFIKDRECVMELNSRQLYAYLANVFLCPTREIDVFATCMTWWYENSVRDSFQVGFPDVTTLFVAFLNCVDFHSLSEGDIREMMLFPDIDTNDVIKNILTSIIEIKFGGGINRNVQAVVNILLNGNPRRKNNYPCVLIDPAQSPECGSFECFEERPAGSPKRKYTKYVVLFDEAASSNDVILEITQEKLHNLIGYHILGYKELIFLFGGEYYYGRGHWNSSFWVYNTIVERWERATKMNLGRRHFESCVVGNVVYLVGGTGNFRKLLDNMVWYNYKLNVWSDKIDLPCSGRQIKCCEHNNQLFLLDLNGRCGYLFDLPASRWVRLQINEAGFANVRYPEKFVVASDNDFIYIKGSRVIKLRVVSNKLEVIEERLLNEYNESMESTACNRALYTLYKHITTYKSEVDTDSFEKFDTSTYVSRSFSSYRVRSVIEGTAPEQLSRISNGLRVFTLAHYSMVKRTTYLTRFNV